MIRRHFYLNQEQIDFLKKLPGNISEHIRRAIDDYIEKLKAFNASASQSKRRERE